MEEKMRLTNEQLEQIYRYVKQRIEEDAAKQSSAQFAMWVAELNDRTAQTVKQITGQ